MIHIMVIMSYLNHPHHVIQVWSLALVAKESKLVVGSSDRELRVWELELTGAEQEVDVAQEKATIGQKRGPPSGDDMMANDVTENSERNVSHFVVLYTTYSIQGHLYAVDLWPCDP